MSNEEICDALIAAMGNLSLVGLTSAGSEMTWDENGAVSKDPAAVVIENGDLRHRPNRGKSVIQSRAGCRWRHLAAPLRFCGRTSEHGTAPFPGSCHNREKREV